MSLPQPFSGVTTYPGHSGGDYPERGGTPVPASGPGIVIHSGWWNDAAAYGVIVDYGNCTVLYCHFDRAADLRVARGSRVSEGTILALVGKSGSRSSGYHLHMEIMTGKGAHTYAGLWNYFSRTAVVGKGGGNVTPPKPAPAPTKEQDSRMHLYYLDNIDGNGTPGWALLNDSAPIHQQDKNGANPILLPASTSGSGPLVKKYKKIFGIQELAVDRNEYETAIAVVRLAHGVR